MPSSLQHPCQLPGQFSEEFADFANKGVLVRVRLLGTQILARDLQIEWLALAFSQRDAR
jgi:hypothetical protein